MTIDSVANPPLLYQPLSEDADPKRIFGTSKSNVAQFSSYNLSESVNGFLNHLNEVLSSPAGIDAAAFKSLFVSVGAWKDHLSLQWDFYTFNYESFQDKLIPLISSSEINNFSVMVHESTKHQSIKPFALHPGSVEWIDLFVEFTTKVGKGSGLLRLVPVLDADAAFGLKIFTIYTMLESINGHEDAINEKRPPGVNHGQHKDRESWLEKRAREVENPEPAVLIVGAGQNGLNVASRLKALGIKSLIVDKNLNVGDNWKNRYKFLCLHDPTYENDFAFMPFPKTWPKFTPKDKLAEWFQFYAKVMDLNIWMDSTVDKAVYDKATGTWTVSILKGLSGGKPETLIINPRHVVMATGHSGEPNVPKFKGMEKFKGKIIHSSQHTTGKDYKGKNAVVIGCCNSAHDISQDFYEQGASVTMIQRSSTCVISADDGMALLYKGSYEENGLPTESADMLIHSQPVELYNILFGQLTRRTSALDADLLAGLAKAGFKLDYGYGGGGFFSKYFRRGGGYYLDVGASKLIMDGDIKLKSGVEVKEFHENSVEFTDGSIIEDLDIAVLATGYSNMKDTATRIFGTEVSKHLNPVWGYGEDGDMKAVWRSSGHEGFWYMGGHIALARFMSKKLVLQIAAEEFGVKAKGQTKIISPVKSF